MSKRGRPPKPEGERAGKVLQIRLTAAERMAWAESAELAGMTVSAWVKDRLNKRHEGGMLSSEISRTRKRLSILVELQEALKDPEIAELLRGLVLPGDTETDLNLLSETISGAK